MKEWIVQFRVIIEHESWDFRNTFCAIKFPKLADSHDLSMVDFWGNGTCWVGSGLKGLVGSVLCFCSVVSLWSMIFRVCWWAKVFQCASSMLFQSCVVCGLLISDKKSQTVFQRCDTSLHSLFITRVYYHTLVYSGLNWNAREHPSVYLSVCAPNRRYFIHYQWGSLSATLFLCLPEEFSCMSTFF